MALYTRTGDAGETSLADGSRVGKDHVRVAACGDVDELNASLGWCRGASGPETITNRIHTLQNELCAIIAELAMPLDTGQAAGVSRIDAACGARLETWIDEAVAGVKPLRSFIVPGGTERACRFHLARACCRRAERSVVALARTSRVRPEILTYLNRLGDLLFAWARQANRAENVQDSQWTPE